MSSDPPLTQQEVHPQSLYAYGRALYKIELPTGVVGYFDKTDYRRVYLDNPQHDGSVVRTKVLAYEELPLTPENERLLSIIAEHPGASVQAGSLPAK